MAKSLPPQPNLEYLKKQAKALLKACKQSNPEVIPRIKEHHPRLSGSPDSDILSSAFSLQDAQLVIAREYGFESWPKLSATVSQLKENLMSALPAFEDVPQLTDRETQILLRETKTQDVVLGLKDASTPVKEKFLTNMSTRTRALFEKWIDALGDRDPKEIEAARQRISEWLAKSVSDGRIVWPPEKKEPTPKPKAEREINKSRQETESPIKRYGQRPIPQLSLDELTTLIVTLAELARRLGVLSLERVEQYIEDPLVRKAVELVVDGVDTDQVRETLEELMQSLLKNQELMYRKAIDGMIAIQRGVTPPIIEEHLQATS